MAPPKAILFDIGGVCVASPFQAILDYETAHGIPHGWVNYSISQTAPRGAWHRLERGEIAPDAAFFAAFNHDLHDQQRWRDFCGCADAAPPPPIDGERLFLDMMRASRAPDPHMWPALRRLRATHRFVLGALSNTACFPADHPLRPPPDLSNAFDVFVSSAHVGLRKPDPRIYALALRELDRVARERGGGGMEPHDVVFLDDIGENLKPARAAGFVTIKVDLGRTRAAVARLEELTGLQLAGDPAEVPKPNL